MEKFGHYLLANKNIAMLFAMLFALLPFMSFMSLLIVGLVSLRQDLKTSFMVMLASIFPFIVLMLWFGSGLTWPIVYSMAINVLLWGVAILLRLTVSWRTVLWSALGLGLLVVLVAHFVHPDLMGWWENTLKSALQTLFSHQTTFSDEERQTLKLTVEQGTHLADFSQVATGFVVSFLLVTVVTFLVLSRWWQANLFYPGGLRKELYALHFDYKTVVVFAVVSLLVYLDVDVAADCVSLFLCFYVFAGLSLLHCWASAKLTRPLWFLLPFYVGFVIVYPILLGVVALGIMDGVVDFRKRFALQ
jgi:hypothetical protein